MQGLLLIDNLTCTPEEDPALRQLVGRPFGILMTSRLGALDGFETYPLSDPTAATGTLIFRDNYGKPLDREDQRILTEMMEDQALCHPLTLRLMARAAQSRGWTVRELQARLEKKDTALSWQEEGRTVRLGQVYRQLYSYLRIPEECQDLAELFTLLPRDSYSLEFLTRWFLDVVDAGATEKLEALTAGGWLDQDDSGYSMHPLIAQCLRRTVITEERVGPVLRHIQNRIGSMQYHTPDVFADEELYRLCEILLYVMGLLSGRLSRELLLAGLWAAGNRNANVETKKQLAQRMTQWIRRCPEADDEIQVMDGAVFGDIRLAENPEHWLAMFHSQREHLTVPEHVFVEFANWSIQYLGNAGDSQTLEAAAKEVIQRAVVPEQKVNAYLGMFACVELQNKKEEAMQWLQKGAAYVDAHPEVSASGKITLFSRLSEIYVVFGQQKEAREFLDRVPELMYDKCPARVKATYSMAAGTYALYFGDPETAIAHYREAMCIEEEYVGKGENYYVFVLQIATASLKLKRYADALESYTQLLAYAQKTGDQRLHHFASNNAAVACLELNQPREALKHLENAMIVAREAGGIALGEAQRNRARAFGQLGDTEQEYACLQEASPLLDAAYGPGHPRAAAARQRLAELENRESK